AGPPPSRVGDRVLTLCPFRRGACRRQETAACSPQRGHLTAVSTSSRARFVRSIHAMRTVYAWWIPLFAIALLAITGAALRATGDAPRVVVQRQESPPASGAALGSAAGAQGSNADGTSNDRSDTSEITG